MKLVNARMQVLADSRDEFIRESALVADASLKEDGCLEFSIYEDALNPNHFISFHRWDSAVALDRHLQQPHVLRMLSVLDRVTEAPLEVRIYDIIPASTDGLDAIVRTPQDTIHRTS